MTTEIAQIDSGSFKETILFHGSIKTEAEIRTVIQRLEDAMMGLPQIDLPLKHTFTTGVYSREIFLPKDSIVVGKIHRHDHLNFISHGKVTVLTKDGLQTISGPCTMVSSAGTKRAVYAHEDTVWTTIHANPDDEKDIDKLEEVIIAKNYDEFPIHEKVEMIEETKMIEEKAS